MNNISPINLKVLQQSEHKFRSLFESMFEGFFLYEVIYDDKEQPYDYRYIELNDAAVKLMGLPREKMLGSTLRTLLHEVSPAWQDYYSRAANGENLEFEEFSPALEKYIKMIMYAPLPGYLAALTIDVTQRKQTEAALRLSEERLRYSLEAADEGYWDWDVKSDKVYFSPRYYTMLGYEPYEFEMNYDSWISLMHPDQREWLPERAVNESILKDNFSIEFQLRSKSGDYRWILSHWKVFGRDKNGVPFRVIGTHSDITERKQTEEALILNERRMSLILDTVPVAFFDVDVFNEFSIKWISKSVERLTGFTPEKFINDQEFWKSRVHKDDQPDLAEILRTAKDLFQIEHRLKCADNRYKWFLYRVFIIRTVQGEPIKIIGLMHDISKSKSYEKKLKASEKQARALSTHLENVREEERKTLARDVHDELGQSLTVLKLMAKSIKKDLLKGKTVDPSELDEMTNLISTTIKSVQRITTELRPDILDTAGLIAAIEWQAETFSRHNEVECWMDLKDFISCEFNSCVSTIIFRTVQESLTNVSRHASASRVKLSLKKSAGNAVLLIEDNGIGISSKKMKDMTSFGLKGMQERAAFAGGKLTINGRKGNGTTVTLKIPLERALTKFVNPKTN